jgi:hypothetical protein
MQRIDNPPETTIHDLQPGDIFIFNFYGVPHAGIYVPTPGGQGDIIHMFFDGDRTGATKSTISKLLKDGKDVYMFRHKKIDGEAVAAQADFWLNQGIEYSKSRLARSLYDYGDDESTEEMNILKYFLFAARRETAPVKSHIFPCEPTSKITDTGVGMLLPDYTYCRPLTFVGANLAMYGAKDRSRPKGLTCITFVLACLAAVALKDDVTPVNGKTGWVSLKHGTDELGIQDIFTNDQIANCNPVTVREKLSPEFTKMDPHKPSPFEFFEMLKNDTSRWRLLGRLNNAIVKPFNQQAYHAEKIQLAKNIKANRQKFVETFGEAIFNRDPNHPYRHFTVFNEAVNTNKKAEVNMESLQPKV